MGERASAYNSRQQQKMKEKREKSLGSYCLRTMNGSKAEREDPVMRFDVGR